MPGSQLVEPSLDRTDKKILDELQKDGRITNVELARRVGLTPSPCLERVRRLERLGVIAGYQARLNPDKLGSSLLVFVEITLNRESPDLFERFSAAVKLVDEIESCYLVSGNFDYLLKARVPSMAHYQKLMSKTLLRLPGIADSRTYVVMDAVKESPGIALR